MFWHQKLFPCSSDTLNKLSDSSGLSLPSNMLVKLCLLSWTPAFAQKKSKAEGLNEKS